MKLSREKLRKMAEYLQRPDWELTNEEEGVRMFSCKIEGFNTV